MFLLVSVSVWARGRCRISPPRFLAECCKRQLNQAIVMFLLYFRLFTFLICIGFVYLYFPVLFCLSLSVKWLAVKTASEITYTVSSGALNSTPSIHPSPHLSVQCPFWLVILYFVGWDVCFTCSCDGISNIVWHIDAVSEISVRENVCNNL